MAKTPITLRGFDVSMEWVGTGVGVQYTVVKATSTEGCVDTATAITDYPLGIMQNKCAAAVAGVQNAAATVRVSGWSYGVAGAAVSVLDRLKVDSTGRMIAGVKKTTFVAGATFNYSIGIALSAAASANDWFTVEICKGDTDWA